MIHLLRIQPEKLNNKEVIDRRRIKRGPAVPLIATCFSVLILAELMFPKYSNPV
jgi:hypothetical protein